MKVKRMMDHPKRRLSVALSSEAYRRVGSECNGEPYRSQALRRASLTLVSIRPSASLQGYSTGVRFEN